MFESKLDSRSTSDKFVMLGYEADSSPYKCCIASCEEDRLDKTHNQFQKLFAGAG